MLQTHHDPNQEKADSEYKRAIMLLLHATTRWSHVYNDLRITFRRCFPSMARLKTLYVSAVKSWKKSILFAVYNILQSTYIVQTRLK